MWRRRERGRRGRRRRYRGGVRTGGGGDANRPEAADTPTREPAAEADTAGSGGDAADGEDGQPAAARSIIRSGTIVVEVDDFASARSNLTTVVRGYGGYVSDSRGDRRAIDNNTWTRGSVIVRVPSENFDALVTDAGRSAGSNRPRPTPGR